MDITIEEAMDAALDTIIDNPDIENLVILVARTKLYQVSNLLNAGYHIKASFSLSLFEYQFNKIIK